MIQNTLYEQMQQAANYIQQKAPGLQPKAAIILGTGLGGLTKELQNGISIEYQNIPHLVQPTVMEHEGKLWLGTLNNVQVLVFQGRFHAYEGYSLQQISFPVRIAQALTIPNLVVCNVAGGLNPNYKAGDLVMITDHINLLGGSPLIGMNDDRIGSRYPDMIEPYSGAFIQELEAIALQEKIILHKGVYACMSGPQLETRAEYRMLQRLGADLIGMSTVPEVIAAVHGKMKVAALSVVTDECLPDALQPVDIGAIFKHAMNAEPKLIALIKQLVQTL
jgi:purine-nucleoside phosphorylase